MPTDLHQSVVHQLAERGYKTHGAKEFARLAYYLHEDLELDNASELLTHLFQSGVRINHHNATRVAEDARASLVGGKDYPSYREARRDAPVPKGIPDAWMYRESTECPDHMAIEYIEVFDTCRTDMAKVAEYGAEFDHHGHTHFILYELGANDGSVVRHDPLHAFALYMYHEINTGRAGLPISQDVKKAYAEHLRSGQITIQDSLQAA